MKVGIIGMGLMGTSLAMALKKYISKVLVYGYDREKTNLNYVLKCNIIDEILINTNSTELDILFLAVPVKKTIEVLDDIIPYLNLEKVLITDMASTKGYICNVIEREYPSIDFIGGHPMTGRELCGPQAASPDLFKNMTYVLIEPFNCEKKLCAKKKNLLKILKKIGAETSIMNPDLHDEMVAVTSHLPHFLAAIIVNEIIELEKKYPEIYKLMGQGFRDFTRIAASSPDIWKDIFLTNKENLIEKIDRIVEHILLLQDILRNEDEEKLHKYLISTSKKRISLKQILGEVKS